MKIGFTGTQNGMTKEQRYMLFYVLTECEGEFHHGDCIGADAQAHDIAEERGLHIVIHPPDIMKKRAFKRGSQIRQAKPYLYRNRDIVNECDELIATPKEFDEQKRSGTWSTIRYARKMKKKVTIIYPNGAWIV